MIFDVSKQMTKLKTRVGDSISFTDIWTNKFQTNQITFILYLNIY